MPSAAVGRFRRDRVAMASLVLLAALALFAFGGPLVWRWDHLIHREIPSGRPPSWSHPFGTDRVGHDLMGQVMRGLQQSLRIGIVASAISTTIGTAWGLAAGWFRGWVDAVLMRAVDVALMVPALVVVLVLAGGSDGTTWLHLAVLLGLVGWLRPARVVRGLTLSIRERGYVEAARAMGGSDLHLVRRHVLPNLVSAVVVDATFAVSLAVLSEAALSFLGFGVVVPDTSLGLLVSNGQASIATRPWLFYLPGAFLVVLCLLVHLVGDGIRDAVDPGRDRDGVNRPRRARRAARSGS